MGRHGVIEIELTGSLLLVKGAQAFHVTLGFCFLCQIFCQLCFRFVNTSPVKVAVYFEERLVPFHALSFLEKHLFQVAFDAGSHFDESFCPDLPDVFSVYFHVFYSYFFYSHYLSLRFVLVFTTGQENE